MIPRLTIAAALVAALCGVATAQPNDKERARKHFDQAEAYLKASLFDKAADEYQAAYDISKVPVLLFNLGLAREKQGELEAAVAAYDRYLAAEPDGIKSAEARARAEALRRTVAERATVPPSDEVEPPPDDTANKPPLDEVEPRPEIKVEPPPPSRPSLVPAIAVGAGGLALFAVGVGFGVSASGTLDDLDSNLDTGAPPLDSGDPRFESGKRAALYADLAFAASGVSLVVAGVLAYRALRGGHDESPVAVAPTAGGAVVEVRW